MDSRELYEKARELQDGKKDHDAALELYQQIIREFPESTQAERASEQIDNILRRIMRPLQAKATESGRQEVPDTSPANKKNPTSAPGIVTAVKMRFPVLSFVSLMLRIIGWLVAVGGIVVIVVGITSEQIEAIKIAAGVLTVVVGLSIVALGEVIGVLFAIEDNTRRSAEFWRHHSSDISRYTEERTESR